MVLGLQREKLLGEVRTICLVGEGFVFVGFGVLLVWFDVFCFFFFPTLVCKTPSLQPGLRVGVAPGGRAICGGDGAARDLPARDLM